MAVCLAGEREKPALLLIRPSFSRFADMIDALLTRLGVWAFHLYLHDYGGAGGNGRRPELIGSIRRRRGKPKRPHT